MKVLVSYVVGMAGLAVILSVILLATRWDSLWSTVSSADSLER